MNNTVSQQPNSKNRVSVALGKRLKKLRIEAEKTQEELAFDSNVDKTFISAIERGVANPSVLTLANICHGLGITLEELFQSIAFSMKPTETQRRSNMAQPELKPKRPRLR
ncbi:helix-turn-helix domain-containing protein [Herbaspirillum rubrisubalbicans]|uniref:XRE family transcriptional regulator n=1 Tax=Herbaspirillum rubrisubalbicans TaxID=80842 RepID=A0ABX9BUS9_9BURK|nr:helix-turn-helix transcriptional regulator [Herbaspirillum rubrisubalbicans]RAM61479.1 XRE family transcriptional regulator [Herbaspirillum rubrisubalbicans]